LGKENRFDFNELEEPPEYSEPSADLDALLAYLDGLLKDGLKIKQATYCVNAWKLYGFIPLKHHGFIMYAEGKSRDVRPRHTRDMYFTLDFSTRGILWDTFDTYPDVPEGTLFTKTFHINMDPMVLRDYCKATKPFAWPENDCKKWGKGLLRLMDVEEEPYVDEGALDKLTRGDVRVRDLITCGAADKTMGPMGVARGAARLVGCMP